MKLIKQKPFVLGQPFGKNFNNFYASMGDKGHQGLDLGYFYGQPVNSVSMGTVYSVLNKNNPDLMRYRGVYVLIKDENNDWYEISYGHCKDILVSKGDEVIAGQPILTCGNTGPVFSSCV